MAFAYVPPYLARKAAIFVDPWPRAGSAYHPAVVVKNPPGRRAVDASLTRKRSQVQIL
jgi:hypothetical protein